ncbi:hypothetical protein CDAR_113341 [Caerostris darwini]|uniref:Uncharacterized protein n=1 Tax=Caerostris darwini TaxID=1538125 RepID=A0AAV4RB43_9ARAC|nr:hypothetical protein CDAR_113341 [Caerostris darwini]
MTESQKEVEDDSSNNVGSSSSKCRLFIEADTAISLKKIKRQTYRPLAINFITMMGTQKEVEEDSSSNVGSSASKCRFIIVADTAFIH